MNESKFIKGRLNNMPKITSSKKHPNIFLDNEETRPGSKGHYPDHGSDGKTLGTATDPTMTVPCKSMDQQHGEMSPQTEANVNRRPLAHFRGVK